MRHKLLRIALLILSLLIFQSKTVAKEREMKVLVLIICSDQFPGTTLTFPYKEMQEVWRSYMHRDPEHVEAYFIRANPHLNSMYEIQGDVIWSKTEENVIPGILNKTSYLLSLFCLE